MGLITSPTSNPKTHHYFNLHRSFLRPVNPVLGLRPLPQTPNLLSFSEPYKCSSSTKLYTHFLTNSNRLVPSLTTTNAALTESSLEPEPETEVKNRYSILLSGVIVKNPRYVFKGRKWTAMDLATGVVVVGMHALSLLAPFQFNRGALWVAVSLYVVTGLFGITLSYHRNLSHRRLEYLFAYCGAQALQGAQLTGCAHIDTITSFVTLEKTHIAHSKVSGIVT